MMIPASPPGMNAEDDAAGLEEPISDAPDVPSAAPLMVATPTLAYADFAAAVKDALRDAHSPDLLARNPLLRDGLCNLGLSAGPQELRALLCETVGTLFGNPRDEKLRRILELTYSQSALKQEAVADRLSLSFGTYRRHLTTALKPRLRRAFEAKRVRGAPARARAISLVQRRRVSRAWRTTLPTVLSSKKRSRLGLAV